MQKQFKNFVKLALGSRNRERGALTIGTIAGIALIIGLVIAAVTSPGDDFGALDGFLADVFKGIILAASVIIKTVGHSLADLATKLLKNTVTSSFLIKPITSNKNFISGWSQVRDLSNMFIVLGFVMVGIATTLRLRDYEAKKLLLPLIIIALLINFSNVFVGIIIDGSNKLTLHFLKAGGDVGVTIVKTFDDAYNLPPDKGGIDWESLKESDNPNGYIAAMASFAAAYVLIAIVFFYLVFILIARQALFAIFFILAPLAFLCWVFPQTKKIWTMWWENFIKWALIGAQVAFFVWLASKMVTPDVGSQTEKGIIDFLLIVILLFVAVKVATKSSAIGASAVMGLATGAAAYATGGASLLAKGGAKAGGRGLMAGADKLSGGKASQAVQSVKGGVGRTMERMSWLTGRKTGTTAQKESGMIAEEQKGFEAMLKGGNASDRARAMEAARTGRGRKGAGAYAAVVSTGNLNDTFKDGTGKVNTEEMYRRGKFTEQFGAGENLMKEAKKQNHELAGQKEEDVRKELLAMGHTNAATIPIGSTLYNSAKSSVNMKQLEKTWSSKSEQEKADVDLSTFHTRDQREFLMNRSADDLKAFRLRPRFDSNGALDPTRKIINSMASKMRTEAGLANTSKRKRERLEEAANVADTL